MSIFICLQEAKQALELMGKWEMIDVCDALELLSPVFESEEVGVCVTSELLLHVLCHIKLLHGGLSFYFLLLLKSSFKS